MCGLSSLVYRYYFKLYAGLQEFLQLKDANSDWQDIHNVFTLSIRLLYFLLRIEFLYYGNLLHSTAYAREIPHNY